MTPLLEQIRSDAIILLERALRSKTVHCFGIDGFGQYGTSDRARTFTILNVDLLLFGEIYEWPEAYAYIKLEGYSDTDNGLILTDNNFAISLNEHLKAASIDPSIWTWAPVSEQGSTTVAIKLDVKKLISW